MRPNCRTRGYWEHKGRVGMGALSDFAQNELLDHVLNAAYSPAATVYLALSTSVLTFESTVASMSEPSGSGYARVAITFGAAASRKVVQNGQVTFPQVTTTAWGTIQSFAVCDALTAGNILAFGSLSTPLVTAVGNLPTFPDGYVEVDISTGGLSDYLVHKLLDLAFRNQAFSKPDTYAALANVAVVDADTSITEVSGTDYARVQVNPSTGAAPKWTVAADGSAENADSVAFPTVGAGDWTEMLAATIMDASSGGNILMYDNSIVAQTPIEGSVVSWDAGELIALMS